MNCKYAIFYLATFLSVTTANAATNGVYIGGQLGFSDVHQGDFLARHFKGLINKVAPNQSIDSFSVFFTNTGIAGRLFAGFQFTDYFAIELGYYHFKKFDLKVEAYTDPVIKINFEMLNLQDVNLPLHCQSKTSVTTYVVDLATKGILPLTKKLSVYGKLGLAYINAEADINLNINLNIFDFGLLANPSINVIYPEIGIGLSYDIFEHVNTDFSWMHIQRYNGKLFPNIDFFALGLLYRF